jgi:hypothetical protein
MIEDNPDVVVLVGIILILRYERDNADDKV